MEADCSYEEVGTYRLGNVLKNSFSLTSKRNWRLLLFLKENCITICYFPGPLCCYYPSQFVCFIVCFSPLMLEKNRNYIHRGKKIAYAIMVDLR